MLISTLAHALKMKQIEFQRFAFAYCKKNPKALGGIRACSWGAVDPGLKEILINQLTQITEAKVGGSYAKSYEAQFISNPIRPTDHLMDGLTQAEAAESVGPLVNRLVTSSLNLDGVRKTMGILAAKYLAHPSTRTGVLCLVLFNLKLPQGGNEAGCFLTLMDGDETFTIMAYENDNLVTKRLTDVFREKNLMRCALYPWGKDPTYDAKAVYLHVDREALFWPDVMECRRNIATPPEQQDALLRLSSALGTGSKLFSELQRIPKENLHGPELHSAAKAVNPDLPHTAEEVGKILAEHLPQGFVSKKDTVENQARSLTVVAGGIEVSLAPAQVNQIRQVQRGNRRYLVIDIPEDAVLTGRREQTPLRVVQWDDFIEGKG